ncbi:elongin-A, F-box protein Pof4 [Schizosaccharomyces osmophilus]|uniref:Elongin-A, F-box protein Pof4 n=1 Tax=Schizosaccharomyces osmophilus TaxID=2545709 RepID=A0AAF0AUE9_9SCHI|nr:elongin-A, F-box protein Pof4 [Schizosaccharomyces osmophilus]WBW71522.1 elongin-A, F-box protein Pof4 [Schizosaccharomyces osmophilus]
MLSLKDICIQVAQKYINDIEDIGDYPYALLEPILERAPPDRLYLLEERSPHFRQESQSLWKQHVLRDFALELQQFKVSVPSITDWRSLYERMKKRRHTQYNEASEKLRNAYTKLEQTKQNKRIVPLEREPRSARPQKRLRPSNSYAPKSNSAPKSSLMTKARNDFLKKTSFTRPPVSGDSKFRTSNSPLRPLGSSYHRDKQPTTNPYPMSSTIKPPPASNSLKPNSNSNKSRWQRNSTLQSTSSIPISSLFPKSSRMSNQLPKHS